MHFNVVSLFPQLFDIVQDYGVIGRAIEKGLLSLDVFNPREFTIDRHRTVDDRPYGGGPGMVGMVEPWREAIRAAKHSMHEKVNADVKTAYLSPQGQRLTHSLVEDMVQEPGWVLVAGRYEGLDERLIESEIDVEYSIGDYVLSGGELPAMIVIDSVARHVPGVLGHEESAEKDSFNNHRLDHPHYTRPRFLDGMSVPDVLLSGDHRAIDIWRRKQSLGATWLKRPDLLEKMSLSDDDKALLAQFQQEKTN